MSKAEYIQEKVQSIDSFGTHFTMKLDSDRSFVQTYSGTFFTLIMYMVVGVYAYLKTDVYVMKKDVDIMASTQAGFFNDSEIFDYERGLNLAIAFTAYDSETEPILDKSYGEIVFRAYEWGFDPATNQTFVRQDIIPSHPCTVEELDGGAFYPVAAQDQAQRALLLQY